MVYNVISNMNAVIIFCAQYLFLLVILLEILAVIRLGKGIDQKVRFIVAIVIAGVIAFILSRISSKLYYDPRPFVREHVKPLFPHIADNGFPSDHALLTGTLTAIAYFYNKKYATIMLIPTLIIGWARVYAKVHSPIDIAGGWIFGIIGSFAAYYLVRWALSKPWGQDLQKKLISIVKATPVLNKVM